MTRRARGILRDRRGTAALETAVTLPVVVFVMVAMVGVYQVFSSRRAVEYGLEQALRHVAVNSGSATPSSITAAYTSAAKALSPDVGAASKVAVTPASGYAPGQTVQVAVTYQWVPPDPVNFLPTIQMNRTASITIVN